MNPVEEVFSVEDLVVSVSGLFALRAAKKGLTLSWEFGPGCAGFVHGDGHRVRQILCNLLSNATKFTENGRISLVVTREDEDVCFAVSDTGPGIVDAERIFRAFESEDETSTRRHCGAGLGLAIVRRLVEGMRGRVGVESEPGRGSRFWVRLPARQAVETQLQNQLRPGERRSMRVLVVDDNPINLLVIQAMLVEAGHHCEAADTAAQAIHVALSAPWDCVFLDLHMPEVCGEEVAAILRSAGFRGRIVAASADVLPETQARCLANGFDDFLAKPFSEEELLACLPGGVR